MQRNKGRPPTHPMDQLRTRIWFRAILIRSGLPSAYAVEMRLDGERVRKRASDVARPRKWDFYEAGKKVPSDKPGPRNAIDQAEAHFPGTARYFRSPIWKLLKGQHYGRHFIEEAIWQLDSRITDALFEQTPRNGGNSPRWRDFTGKEAEEILQIANFDSLECAILLAELSEAINSPTLREMALRLYMSLQHRLMKLPELERFYEELFTAIDHTFKHWLHIGSNQRMDIVMSWQAYQDDRKRRIAAGELDVDGLP